MILWLIVMCKLFTVFGDPISHSKSPLLHNRAFKSLGLHYCYNRTHLVNGEELKAYFERLELSGANVTVPHKETAFRLCDEVRGIAKQTGAVNTLVKEGDRLIGYNTDGEGFYRAVSALGDFKRVLVLGAGGTAKAVALSLKQHNKHVTILNRSQNRLDFFHDLEIDAYSWNDFSFQPYDLIVNTTSAGLKDEYYPCREEDLVPLLRSASFAFDAIYGKITPFLAMAKKEGCFVADGGAMLVGQAVLAFKHFVQKPIDHQKINDIMKEALVL